MSHKTILKICLWEATLLPLLSAYQAASSRTTWLPTGQLLSDLRLGHSKTDFILPFLFQNEMAIYEFIHNFVEVLDEYFSRVVSLVTTEWLRPEASLPETGLYREHVLMQSFNM